MKNNEQHKSRNQRGLLKPCAQATPKAGRSKGGSRARRMTAVRKTKNLKKKYDVTLQSL